MKTYFDLITEMRLTPARAESRRRRMGFGGIPAMSDRPVTLADTKTEISKTGDAIEPMHDQAYAELKRVAPELHKFITQEAPVPLDPVMTLQFHRTMGNNNQFRSIGMLKQQLRADAQKVWGSEHPAAG